MKKHPKYWLTLAWQAVLTLGYMGTLVVSGNPMFIVGIRGALLLLIGLSALFACVIRPKYRLVPLLWLALVASSPALHRYSIAHPPTPPALPTQSVRLVSFNTGYHDPLTAPSLAPIQAYAPDVMLLQETTPDTHSLIKEAFPGLAYHWEVPHGKYGMALYSRWPILTDTLLWSPGLAMPWPFAQMARIVTHQQDTLRVVNLRLLSPSIVLSGTRPWYTEAQHVHQLRQLYHQQWLAALAALAEYATVVAGDFNQAPGLPMYRELMDTFADAAYDHSEFWQGSWPAGLAWQPPLFRLDWVLTQGQWHVQEYQHIQVPHSDHKAVAVHFLR